MCSFLFRLFLGLTAIIIATLGIVSLTLRFNVLNSQTYKTALDDARIYPAIQKQIDTSLSDISTPEGKAQAVFLGPIINKLKQEDVLRDTVNKNLDNFFDWLNGVKSELIFYFPRQILISSFNKEEVKQVAFTFFEQQFNELTPCTAEEEAALSFEENNFTFPSCKPNVSNAEDLYRSELGKVIDTIFADENPVEAALREAGVSHLTEETKLSDLLKGQSQDQINETQSRLETFKNAVFYWGIASWVLIFISLIFTLIVLVTGRIHLRNMLAGFSTIYFLTGVLVLVIGLSNMPLVTLVINNLPDALRANETAQLYTQVTELIKVLVPSLFRLTVIVGAVLTVIMLLLRITAFILPAPAPRKKAEPKPIEKKPDFPEKKTAENISPL